MIMPYSERAYIAAQHRLDERRTRFHIPVEIWFGNQLLGSNEGPDIAATRQWFYHRSLGCSPRDLIEDEIELGGVYTW